MAVIAGSSSDTPVADEFWAGLSGEDRVAARRLKHVGEPAEGATA
ncbi:hypothetical protein ACFVVU_38780 [Kitasatospora sp. NPDC057965]